MEERGRTCKSCTEMRRANALRSNSVGWLRTASLALLGTAFSFVISGHISGYNNNLFHLEILAGLPTEPQFANDPFVQAMRYWASGFRFRSYGEVDGDAVYPLLLVFNILSRVLFFVGALACATVLGIESFQQRLIFTLLTAAAVTMRGLSHAGRGGLFIETFTQSEVANGTTLLMLASAARGRVAAAFALDGLTFFINAFIAVWNTAPLAIILGTQLRNGTLAWKSAARQGTVGLVIAAIFAFPVLRNIFSNPDFGRPIHFSYIEALTEIYPQHFLVWTLRKLEIAWLFAVAAGAFLASLWMRPRSDFLLGALAGFTALWLFGVVLPWLTQSPTLINLHLLRSSSSLQISATLAFAGLATLWLTKQKSEDDVFFGCVLAVLMCIMRIAPPLILPFLAARRFIPIPPWLLALPFRSLTVGALVVSVAFAGYQTERRLQPLRAARDDWQALGLWARANTAENDIFLFPVADPVLVAGSEVFPFFAHRQFWVSLKGGGAAAWAQSLYPVWRQRMAETMPLGSLDQRLAYAAAHGIAYVVDACQHNSKEVAWRSDRLCVYRVPRETAPTAG